MHFCCKYIYSILNFKCISPDILTKGKRYGYFLIGVWLISSLIIGTVYKSNLKAKLIAPKIYLPFSSLEEVADQNEVTLLGAEGSLLHQLLQVRCHTYFNM